MNMTDVNPTISIVTIIVKGLKHQKTEVVRIDFFLRDLTIYLWETLQIQY